VRIDGSQGEGGGQIVRTSLSLAALTGQEIELEHIRAGRPRPGLAAQHVTCCQAVAQICQGKLEHAELGSQTVRLTPGPVTGGEYEFDVAAVRPSAGSACLVLQSVLPPLAFAPRSSTVRIYGGTDVPWSPVFAYLKHTFAPALARFGIGLELSRSRGGFYPAGGGCITAHVRPCTKTAAVDLRVRGELLGATVISTVTDGLPRRILQRQTSAANHALKAAGIETQVEEHYISSHSPGTSCVISLNYSHGHGGFTTLGKRGKPAEKVGQEATQEAVQFAASDATVDQHLADQLLLYMALAEGRSELRAECVTEHLRTHAAVACQMTDAQVELQENGMLTVTGVAVGAGV
jgi:RNA 3'-terminal phosphate cyclase (ATP)